MICSWAENLSEDEVPPEWMWCFDDLLKSWFEDVKKRREKKFDSSDNSVEWEETELDDNDLATEYRRNMGLTF